MSGAISFNTEKPSQGLNYYGYGNTSHQGATKSFAKKYGAHDVFTASKRIPVNYGNSATGASYLG